MSDFPLPLPPLTALAPAGLPASGDASFAGRGAPPADGWFAPESGNRLPIEAVAGAPGEVDEIVERVLARLGG